MRSRVPTAFVLFALSLGSGTGVATASGPSVSEFETGLTPGVQLWGITSGPDGNTWFTEENNDAVGRVTPGAVITEFTADFPTRSPRGIVTGPDGNLWVAQAGGNGAISRVSKAGDVTEFPVPTAGDPTDIAVGPDGSRRGARRPPRQGEPHERGLPRRDPDRRLRGRRLRVTNGAVVVRDFKRHRNVLVRAGHSYLAKARALRR